MDLEFFKDERYHRCFILKDRETNESHNKLDYLDLYFIELEKFEKKYQTLKTTLDRWVKFLNNADQYSKDALPQELAEIEPIRKASEKLEVMYLSKQEREYYEAQQKRYLDEMSRIQEAVDEAVKEALQKAVDEAVQKAVEQAVEKTAKETAEQIALKTNTEIAQKLISLDSDDDFIAQARGLSREQIERLRNAKQ
jgi:predicted transposase/invertase (TIGR01784 family)